MTNHHAEVARDLLYHAESTMNKERAEEFTASAQAHATLALADEQRTANLIAYLTFRSNLGTFPANDATTFVDIATRLGLD